MSEILQQNIPEKKPEVLRNLPAEYREALENLKLDDVSEIMNLLLNSARYETSVNQFVRHFTGQTELENYQRVLTAPANGIENVITFFCGLFTREGLGEIADGIRNISESPEVLRDVWTVFYEKLTPTQKLAVGIEMGTNMAVFGKIIARFLKIFRGFAKKKIMIEKISPALSASSIVATGIKPLENAGDYGKAWQAQNTDKEN